VLSVLCEPVALWAHVVPWSVFISCVVPSLSFLTTVVYGVAVCLVVFSWDASMRAHELRLYTYGPSDRCILSLLVPFTIHPPTTPHIHPHHHHYNNDVHNPLLSVDSRISSMGPVSRPRYHVNVVSGRWSVAIVNSTTAPVPAPATSSQFPDAHLAMSSLQHGGSASTTSASSASASPVGLASSSVSSNAAPDVSADGWTSLFAPLKPWQTCLERFQGS
jgi:hypothetical protein